MKKYNQLLGSEGESIATDYLQKLGYTILERNWRYQRAEVDIIATKNDVLYIVEVKTRTNTTFGMPEESVSKTKFNLLQLAAEAYMYLNTRYILLQFCIIAIILPKGQPPEIMMFEDVYF